MINESIGIPTAIQNLSNNFFICSFVTTTFAFIGKRAIFMWNSFRFIFCQVVTGIFYTYLVNVVAYILCTATNSELVDIDVPHYYP